MKSLTRNLSLSNREEQILLLASRGLTDRQISGELGIRAGTINTHWSRIRLKLGAATRSEAVSILLKEKANVTQQVLEAEKQTLLEDIVLRKQSEQELRDSKKLLQTVLANAPIILWSTDDQGNFLTIEGKVLSAVGLKPASGIKQRSAVLSKVISEDALSRGLAGQEITEVAEYEGVWLETMIAPMIGPKGGVAGLIGVSTDVTERKNVESTLLESREFLHGILEMSPIITHVHDLVHDRHVYTSPSVQAILGFTPQQIQAMNGKQRSSFVHPDDLERVNKHVEGMKAAKDGEVRESVHRLKVAAGDYRWFVQRACVFKRNAQGGVECILTVAQDVHDLKEAKR